MEAGSAEAEVAAADVTVDAEAAEVAIDGHAEDGSALGPAAEQLALRSDLAAAAGAPGLAADEPPQAAHDTAPVVAVAALLP